MRRIILVILVTIAMTLAASPLPAADAAKGKDIYTKKCVSCHAAGGEGKESVAKMLKAEMRPLGSKEVMARSDADFKKVVLDGNGKMKAVKDIDAAGLDNLVAYLRTLAKK